MKKMDRRHFLKTVAVAGGAAVAGFPTIVKASALGKDGAVAASDRIVMAGIGFGMMGPGNMASFLEKPEVQWVAVCDLDTEPLAMAKGMVDKKYGNKACATYHDFRELYLRKDLDAVSIAVPDHWHAILSHLGPAGRTRRLRREAADPQPARGPGPVRRGQALRPRLADGLVAALGRELPPGLRSSSATGASARSRGSRSGCRPGTTTSPGPSARRRWSRRRANLDYEFWVGPAPWWPYCKARVHMNWRWNMDFGGGQYMDWIGHHLDIAHWGMGWDETGPVEIEAVGEYPTSGIYNSPTRYYVKAKYADGTPMVLAGGHDEIWSGTKWIGEYGWIWVDRGQFETEPASLKREVIGPEEIRLYKSRDHHQNFLDCVRSRAKTITPAETAHRSASVGHLGVIAMETGRKIKWDPATETIIGDPEAERLLGHSYRKPWQLPE